MLMEMCMKVSGRMTKLMAKESTHMLTVQDMKESGLKINSMAMEQRDGLTEHHTKGIMPKERNTERVNLHGLTIALILEISMITIFMEQAFTSGLMAEFIQVNGKTTKWKVMELSLGLTAGNMQESILTI